MTVCNQGFLVEMGREVLPWVLVDSVLERRQITLSELKENRVMCIVNPIINFLQMYQD